jgi:hypothetical protein
MISASLWSKLTGRTHHAACLMIYYRTCLLPFRSTSGSHLGLILGVCQHVSSLGYANDLKNFITIESFDDYHRFQSDMNRLQEWCSGRKFGLNAAKCKLITFNRKINPLGLTTALRVILDTRMSFLSHVESPARTLGFVMCISREFNDHHTVCIVGQIES